MIKLYNTLSHKIETFRPISPEEVKIYTCGPTVYSTPHIGNFAAYIYWDLLVRTLLANGYGVRRVLNLTDVGHLVSDGDDGEDKLEKGARSTGQDVWAVAKYFTELFQKDFRELDLLEPAVWARATDYIEEDKKIVDILTKKGYTYETADGIYFDTSKFPRYADFARLNLGGLQAGKRVAYSVEKKHASDFAIWKFIQPGEQHTMRWNYLDRPGYPGWHLECSAIIHQRLGETIDIHAGGIDHIPIHHTNEIAQSEAAFEKKLANYWLHCNFLTIDGEKISKSKGNVYTLEQLMQRGFSPFDFKLWVLQGHFQSERNFTIEQLAAAKARRLSWRNQIARCYQGQENKTILANEFAKIIEALNDNLNSPLAFAKIDELGVGNLELWRKIDQLFGLGLLTDAPMLTPQQELLLQQRSQARHDKDFLKSDAIRDALKGQGITILDDSDGQIWQYTADFLEKNRA